MIATKKYVNQVEALNTVVEMAGKLYNMGVIDVEDFLTTSETLQKLHKVAFDGLETEMREITSKILDHKHDYSNGIIINDTIKGYCSCGSIQFKDGEK